MRIWLILKDTIMEFNFDNDGEESFTVVYENIIKAKDLMPITRTLAMDLSTTGYMSVGDFLEGLSDTDLDNLLAISEDQEREEFSEILLISEMLATGEGLNSASNREETVNRMTHLCVLLACESLFRKGLVKLHRENMSFGADMSNKIIVEKL
jgi:hypothetical protein